MATSKIKSGKITFEEIPFNLPALISSVKSSNEQFAIEKGIRFRIRRDIDIPDIVIGDPLRLTQVLNTLINNAIKFTDKGAVTMDVLLNDNTSTQISVHFAIEDTGIGIDDSLKDYLFTGSLSVAKQLLLLQDSDIQMNSVAGKGSTLSFVLTFKRGEEDTNPAVQNVAPDIQQFAGKRILLAEDNEINRIIATKYLQRWSLNVDYATTGKEAVDKMKMNGYDLILMDLQMPGLDGYQASQQIRTLNRTIPIIALTAHLIPEIRSEALRSGMNECIAKPFNPQALLTVFTKYLV